jgi:hypothetical protein
MMHRVFCLLAPAAVAAALAGCATMSEDDCALADWRALGVRDGTRGQTLAMGERRASACTRHGFAMDWDAYAAGRDAGLAEWCVPVNGFNLGESGSAYNGVCHRHDERAFLAAWEHGHTLHAFRSAIDGAARALRDAEERYRTLDLELQRYEEGYRDEDRSPEEHNEMVLGLWAERKYLLREAIPYWQYAHRYLTEQFDGWQVSTAPAPAQPRIFPGPAPHAGPTQADAREMLGEVFSRFARQVPEMDEGDAP